MKNFDLDSAAANQQVGVNKACEVLDISRATFYRLVKANKIRLNKIGTSSKVSVGNLRQLIGAA